jgi:hypothetical protein
VRCGLVLSRNGYDGRKLGRATILRDRSETTSMERAMAYFFVSYDLVNEQGSFDYQPLWAEFNRLGGVKVLDSAYFLDLHHTTEELHHHLREFMDSDDRLVVVAFSNMPACTVTLQGTHGWLGDRFSPGAGAREQSRKTI